MCGRYSIRKPVTKTADLVKTNIKVEDTDNYNAHPTQKLPVIKSYSNGKALELYKAQEPYHLNRILLQVTFELGVHYNYLYPQP